MNRPRKPWESGTRNRVPYRSTPGATPTSRPAQTYRSTQQLPTASLPANSRLTEFMSQMQQSTGSGSGTAYRPPPPAPSMSMPPRSQPMMYGYGRDSYPREDYYSPYQQTEARYRMYPEYSTTQRPIPDFRNQPPRFQTFAPGIVPQLPRAPMEPSFASEALYLVGFAALAVVGACVYLYKRMSVCILSYFCSGVYKDRNQKNYRQI